MLDIVVLVEIAIEVLVVPHLVTLDEADQAPEYGLHGEVSDRPVIGCRAHLDHAAGGHFQAVRTFQFLRRAAARVIGQESGKGGLPVELGPDAVHVGAQGSSMLQLLRLPMVGEPGGNVRIVVESLHEVARVQIGASLDERCAGE